ncbi:hypothetical protein FM107_16165 [Sphingobacterium sp. JB170]|nr:hypothetical protein FM107_16165 [Sphingobacterium sp. JB170]
MVSTRDWAAKFVVVSIKKGVTIAHKQFLNPKDFKLQNIFSLLFRIRLN